MPRLPYFGKIHNLFISAKFSILGPSTERKQKKKEKVNLDIASQKKTVFIPHCRF
jgi:hypothetical protein